MCVTGVEERLKARHYCGREEKGCARANLRPVERERVCRHVMHVWVRDSRTERETRDGMHDDDDDGIAGHKCRMMRRWEEEHEEVWLIEDERMRGCRA